MHLSNLTKRHIERTSQSAHQKATKSKSVHRKCNASKAVKDKNVLNQHTRYVAPGERTHFAAEAIATIKRWPLLQSHGAVYNNTVPARPF